MPVLKGNCPLCGAVLTIPAGAAGKKGRCRACGQTFLIDQALLGPKAVSAEEVVAWLSEAPPAQPPQELQPADADAESQAQTAAGKDQQASRAHRAARTGPSPGDGHAPAASSEAVTAHVTIDLDHVDEMGAFFLFDSRLLHDAGFRGGFAQQCVTCGSTDSLSVHVIDWSGKKGGTVSSDKSTQHASCVYELDRFDGRSGRELAELLGPRVNQMPEPYCFPFPYYVCPLCSPVGALVPDVRPTADRTHEICELGIASLPQAYEFAKATCGPEGEVTRLVRQEMRKGTGHEWRRLPLAVRIRINQWYKSQEGEVFRAYIQDAEFSKAEAGLAGLVVTDQRLVYHKSLAQVEMRVSDVITLQRTAAGKLLKLTIASEDGQTARVTVTASSAAQLEDLLRQVRAKR